MATVSVVFRTCGTIIVIVNLCLCLCAARYTSSIPIVQSFSVTYLNNLKSLENDKFLESVVVFHGNGFSGNMHWKISSKSDVYGSTCDEFVDESNVFEMEATEDKYVAKIKIPVTSKNVYFCLFSNGRWVHQGARLTFTPSEIDNTVYFHQDSVENKENKHLDSSDDVPSADAEITESSSNGVDGSNLSESLIDNSVLNKMYSNEIPNTNFLNKFTNSFRKSEVQDRDLNDLEMSNYMKHNVLSVMADYGNNVPGDTRTFPSVYSSVDYLDIPKSINKDHNKQLSNKMYKKENYRENLEKSDNYYGNLDGMDFSVQLNEPELSKDIDFNYVVDKNIVPTKNNLVADKINEISIHKRGEALNKTDKDNYEVNTWNYFIKTSSGEVPSHWIDLSHDIDVNYPSQGSEMVLNVEGEDVEKNIFDKDFEDLDTENPLNDQIEIDYNIDTIGGSKLPGKEQNVETFQRIHQNHEFIQGEQNEIKNAYVRNNESSRKIPKRRKREISTIDQTPQSLTTGSLETATLSHVVLRTEEEPDPLRIISLRLEVTSKEPVIEEDGVPQILSGSDAVIRLFGTGFTEDTLITFTHEPQVRGGPCQFPVTGVFTLEKSTIVHRVDKDKFSTAKVKVTLPSGEGTFYLCAKKPTASVENSGASPELMPFVHQGSEPWLQIRTFDKLLPLWASLMIITTCLMFSALFSGLNLGLMSLDRTELKILCNTGSEKEKEYARVIQPVRDHGNFLLCSILLGNVAVNSTFTILLDDLTSGLVAVVCSTITIVLLGEITPQAICSRYGLAVGAKTIHVTKAVMVITFPLSYPVSKLLDVLLGEEIGNVYNRERLKELVRVTNDINDLDKDEVNIISGALELRKKTVLEIMTKIEDVFMLDYEAVLDFETVSEIMKSGFSRIPVYENQRSTIVAMLYVKDLAFVDPDDNTPLKTLCQFYQNPCNFVFEDVTLDVIFKQFKEGHKGHLAFVQRVNSEGEGDPFYETVGLVTLEDVIEELIQAEIMDETDVFTDNKSKRRRNRPLNKLQDFGVFAERRENQRIRISPQLTLATFQYLSTSVEAFRHDNVSETILRRLLKQDVIHHIKFRNKERQKLDPTTLIYEQGTPVDYFVLILEGRVEVTVGKENLMFESGPFTYFGSQALMQNIGVAESPVVPPSALGSLQSINMDSILRYTFIPDYSVRAVTEVFYVSIKRSLYLAAKRATLMERCSGSRHKGSEDAGEQFDDEVEKLLHSLEEEGSPVTTARSPSHHLNSSRHASPLGPNGSIKTSRQSSPAKQAPVAQQEPEFMDTTPTLPQETSTLLPHS